MYTGRYREGVDDENYPKWKTNLRCAMNKAKDIKVIDEESRPEATEPFKIYKFVPQPSKCHLFLTRSVMFLQPCIKFCNCILHKLLRSRIQCFVFVTEKGSNIHKKLYAKEENVSIFLFILTLV